MTPEAHLEFGGDVGGLSAVYADTGFFCNKRKSIAILRPAGRVRIMAIHAFDVSIRRRNQDILARLVDSRRKFYRMVRNLVEFGANISPRNVTVMTGQAVIFLVAEIQQVAPIACRMWRMTIGATMFRDSPP
jgi:hypothetical protein